MGQFVYIFSRLDWFWGVLLRRISFFWPRQSELPRANEHSHEREIRIVYNRTAYSSNEREGSQRQDGLRDTTYLNMAHAVEAVSTRGGPGKAHKVMRPHAVEAWHGAAASSMSFLFHNNYSDSIHKYVNSNPFPKRITS